MRVCVCGCVGGYYLSRREDGMNAGLGEGLTTEIWRPIYASSSFASGLSDVTFLTRLHAIRNLI